MREREREINKTFTYNRFSLPFNLLRFRVYRAPLLYYHYYFFIITYYYFYYYYLMYECRAVPAWHLNAARQERAPSASVYLNVHVPWGIQGNSWYAPLSWYNVIPPRDPCALRDRVRGAQWIGRVPRESGFSRWTPTNTSVTRHLWIRSGVHARVGLDEQEFRIIICIIIINVLLRRMYVWTRERMLYIKVKKKKYEQIKSIAFGRHPKRPERITMINVQLKKCHGKQLRTLLEKNSE